MVRGRRTRAPLASVAAVALSEVILAGGKGVRLKPFTTTLRNHLGPLIKAFAGDGSRWGITVDYAEELVLLTDFDVGDLLRQHEASGAPLPAAACAAQAHRGAGVTRVLDAR